MSHAGDCENTGQVLEPVGDPLISELALNRRTVRGRSPEILPKNDWIEAMRSEPLDVKLMTSKQAAQGRGSKIVDVINSDVSIFPAENSLRKRSMVAHSVTTSNIPEG